MFSLASYTLAEMLTMVTMVANGGQVTISRIIDNHKQRLYVPDRLSGYDQENPLKFIDITGYQAVKIEIYNALTKPDGPPTRGIIMHGPFHWLNRMFARAIATDRNRNMFILHLANVIRPLVPDRSFLVFRHNWCQKKNLNVKYLPVLLLPFRTTSPTPL